MSAFKASLDGNSGMNAFISCLMHMFTTLAPSFLLRMAPSGLGSCGCDRPAKSWYFQQRVVYYKHFDGRDGKLNWYTYLLECLQAWQMRFPDVVQGRRISIETEPRPDVGVPAEWQGVAAPSKWF